MAKIRQNLSIIIILTVTLTALFFITQTALAKQEVSNKQINLNIAFNFQGPIGQENKIELVAQWQEKINQIWNNYDYQAIQIPIEIQINTLILNQNQTCLNAPIGFHCIDIVDQEKNIRGAVADVSKYKANQCSYGQWTIYTTPNQAAHEAGHLLGLSEDYHYKIINNQKTYINDNPQPGKTQSIMAQTWGPVTALPEHINKIIELNK